MAHFPASTGLSPSVWTMIADGLLYWRSQPTTREAEIGSSPALDAIYGRETDQQDTPPSLLMFIL